MQEYLTIIFAWRKASEPKQKPDWPLSLILSQGKSNQWSEQPNLFVWSFARN